MSTAVILASTTAMMLALLRVVLGPSLADRVVGLDLMAVGATGIAIGFYMHYGYTSFLDIAIALALVSFVGTVAFANYIERRSNA